MSAGMVLALHSVELAIEGVGRSQQSCQERTCVKHDCPCKRELLQPSAQAFYPSAAFTSSAIGAAVSRSWQVGVVHGHRIICSIAKRFVKGLVSQHMPAPMTEPQPQPKPEPASKDEPVQLTRPSVPCQLCLQAT